MAKSSPFPDDSLPSRPGRAEVLGVGEWQVDLSSGRLAGPSGETRLEPKVVDCLAQLVSRAGEVVGHAELVAALWPDVIVGPDSLARAIFKLRAALGDDPRQPRYIETIPKRGYRLVATVVHSPPEPAIVPVAARPKSRRWPGFVLAGVVLAGTALLLLQNWERFPRPSGPASRSPSGPSAGHTELTDRATDFYYQFSHAENEAAIELYERVLAVDGSDPIALTGLANALTQRVIRWPLGQGTGSPNLTHALASGRLSLEPASEQLEHARQLAERAILEDAGSSAAHKAFGLVLAAQGELESALAAHHEALRLDPDSWSAMINVADVLQIQGDDAGALPWLERAFAAMERGYATEPVRIRPWLTEVAVAIGQRARAQGDVAGAKSWLRRALELTPLHREATLELVASLVASGEVSEAERLCSELEAKLLVPRSTCWPSE